MTIGMTTRSAPVHARWVRLTHWVAAASVAALAFKRLTVTAENGGAICKLFVFQRPHRIHA